MTLAAALKASTLFADLDPGEIELLTRVLVERRVKAGDYLVREGERPHPVGDALFLILEGQVHVVTESRRRAGKGPLTVLGPGEFIGVASLLDDSPRSASCVMAEPGRVACLSSRTLDALVHSDIRLAARVEHALARQLARDLRMFTHSLQERLDALDA